jgi:hypothetical protein
MPRVNPGWRRKHPDRIADRCWCGWTPPPPRGRHDPAYIGHAPTCPTNFLWIVSEEHLAEMRMVLMCWAELAQTGPDGWQPVRELWAQGLVNRAIQAGWERP